MTTNFEKQKEAHGGERARAKRQDAYTQYATSADFCRLFYEETDRLYRLSFLLTADQEKAQHCLVSGLEDSVKGNPVLKEWARSWARRTIIQSAVRVIHPRPNEEHTVSNFGRYDKMLASEPPEFVAVLLLDAFERFVYVMSVLEHYSVHDCSLLLGCAQREVVAGRVRALQQTGSAMGLSNGDEPAQGWTQRHRIQPHRSKSHVSQANEADFHDFFLLILLTSRS